MSAHRPIKKIPFHKSISAQQSVSRSIKFFAQLSFKKARSPFPQKTALRIFSQKKLLSNQINCAIIQPDTGYASLNRKQVRFLREPVTVNADVDCSQPASAGLPRPETPLGIRTREGMTADCRISRDTCPLSEMKPRVPALFITFRRCPTILYF